MDLLRDTEAQGNGHELSTTLIVIPKSSTVHYDVVGELSLTASSDPWLAIPDQEPHHAWSDPCFPLSWYW